MTRLQMYALLAGLAGCDRLFGIDHVDPDAFQRDAGTDGSTIDAALAMHDEDGDGYDDNIDVCPNVSDDMQRDEDGDGVGDLCDPHPADPHDRLYFFDAFEGAVLSPRWTKSGGAWSVADGHVAMTSPTVGVTTVLVLDLDRQLLNAPSALAVVESVGQFGAAGAGIYTGNETPPNVTGIGCAYVTSGGNLEFRESRSGQPDPAQQKLAGTGMPVYTFTRSMVDSHPTCSGWRTIDAQTQITSDGTPVTIGRGALVDAQAGQHTTSIAIYEVIP